MTASKAIIEKEYQPKVIVSKQGPNPFTKLTDQELEEYRKEVEQKQKGTEGKGDEWRGEGELNLSVMWGKKHTLLLVFCYGWNDIHNW